MKQWAAMLLLLMTQVAIGQSDWDITERKFDKDVFELRMIYPVGGQYYALGNYKRLVPYENRTDAFQPAYTPVIQRLDLNFNVIWEKRYAEHKSYSIEWLEFAGDAMYASGKELKGPNEDQMAKLMCMDMNGNLRWSRTYPIPSCQGSSGLGITTLPNGDFLATTMGLACSGSAKGVYTMRLRPNGDVVWRQNYHKGRFLWFGGGSSITLDDGNIMRVAFIYPSTKMVIDMPFKLWVYKLNLESGAMMWEKFIDFPAYKVEPRPGVKLPNGDIVCSGVVTDHSTGITLTKTILMTFTQSGELKSHKIWADADVCEIAALVAMPDGYLYTTAQLQNHHAFGHQDETWMEFYKFDTDLNIVEQFRLDTQCWGYLNPCIDGGMYIRNADRIMIFKPR